MENGGINSTLAYKHSEGFNQGLRDLSDISIVYLRGRNVFA